MPPSVSVVVCTRDRPGDLRRCLTAILASRRRDFELLVVDQSTGADTSALVRQVSERDGRIRLIRDEGFGLSRARNIGVSAANCELILFTDDDCEPAPDWLETLAAALDGDPGVAVAFGSVLPGPHDTRLGFVVAYSPKRARRLAGPFGKLFDAGMGANMGLRREAVLAVGGLDEMLGAGAHFPSAEEWDLAYRLLCSGFALLHVPAARVLHHGLRTWETAGSYSRGTYVSIGAMYAKHLRLGRASAACLLLQQIGLASWNVLEGFARLRRPLGFGRLAALLVGCWRSFDLVIDRPSGCYQRRETARARSSRAGSPQPN